MRPRTASTANPAGKPAAEGELDTAEQALKMVDQISDFGASFFGVTAASPFCAKTFSKS